MENTFIGQVFKGENDWWRYVIGILIVLIGWQVIGVIPLVSLGVMYTSNKSELMRAAQDNFMSLGIDNNLFLVALLLMFVFGLLFLCIAVRSVHKRDFKTVLTSRAKFDWKRFFFAFVLWFAVGAVMIFVDYWSHPEDFIWNFDPMKFAVLFVISFALIPLQTSFEEIFMRGYLMQGIGGLAKNRWLPLIITSLIFGLLHGLNPEVAKLGNQLMIYYISTGLLFGVITLMDEGLELPMGLHAANNIVAALLVTTDWTVFQTEALWIDTSEPQLSMLMYIPVFIIYPILLFVLSRKYQWKDWGEKLLGKI